MFVVKNIVCDYAVYHADTGNLICICNLKENAELIADILNCDYNLPCAYSYRLYPNAKYKVIKGGDE